MAFNSSMLAVLHIITGLGNGGAEAVLFRLCKADSQHTRHTVVSLSGPSKYSSLLKEIGVSVHHLNMKSGRLSVSGLLRLWAIIRSETPDVIQTWMYHSNLIGGFVGWLSGHKFVVWGLRHSHLTIRSGGLKTVMVDRLCAIFSRVLPVAIISCSVRGAIDHIDIGYRKDKFVVVHNGYDMSAYVPNLSKRNAIRNELAISEGEMLIGMIARFHPQKDHETLFRALHNLDVTHPGPWKLLLAGYEMVPSNPDLWDLIEKNSLQHRVLLLGLQDDVPALMNAIDIHVLSSSDGEAFPNVVAEAMACGTPCIATDVGDAAVIVGSTGWIVPPKDPQSIHDAIQQAFNLLLISTEWSQRKADCRTSVIERFSVERMVRRYHTVWRGDISSDVLN